MELPGYSPYLNGIFKCLLLILHWHMGIMVKNNHDTGYTYLSHEDILLYEDSNEFQLYCHHDY